MGGPGPILWLWLLSAVATVNYGAAGPLPDGKQLLVTTGPPDILDQMMGDAPRMVRAVKTKEPPIITRFNVNSEIQFRFARTLVTSEVINTADVSQELSYEVVLPENAFITGFLMESGNMTYRSYLTEKDTADAIYSRTVQSGKAGGVLSFRHSNLFEVAVNIEPHQIVTFKLSYEELLERQQGFYRHVVNVNTRQVVPGMKVKVHIVEPRPITTIYTPKFSISNIGVKECSGANINATCISDTEQVTKTIFSNNEVLLEFRISRKEQMRLAKEGAHRGGLSGQFDVLYDVERDSTGGEILVRDGYFIHFYAPPSSGSDYIPKHITFVLDVSGSMSGEKISQVQGAMKNILKTLKDDDLFNVIVFANYVLTWGLDGSSDLRTEDENGNPTGSHNEILSAFPFTQQTNGTAFERINQMNADGGTNIFGALRQAVRTAQKEQSDNPNTTIPIIFFLTDGDANTGYTGDTLINELSKINSAPKIPIYSFSFGEGGNIEFLRKLSAANSGVARTIYQGLDADSQLKGVYDDISHAVLTNITFRYLPEEVDLSSITKMNYHTFFEGSEFVVTGRTIDKNAKKIFAEVSGVQRGMHTNKVQPQTFDDLQPAHKVDLSLISVADPNKTRNAGSMERAWAYLTIKQLVEKAKADPSAEASLKERATELAKEYSFASEVTTLVVVKPDGQTQKTALARIVPPPPEDEPKPVAQPQTAQPDPDTLSGTPDVSNFPTLLQFSRRNPKSLDPKLYNKGTLDDVHWITDKAKRRGYIEIMNSSGIFTGYTILKNPYKLDRSDEDDCIVRGFKGKCRHLSQCVLTEIVNDPIKFQKEFQCQLNNFLAICCPH